MAELKNLYELDLTNCPIQGKLLSAYEQDLCEVFKYLQRKKDRSDYRVLKISQCSFINTFNFFIGNDRKKIKRMDIYV